MFQNNYVENSLNLSTYHVDQPKEAYLRKGLMYIMLQEEFIVFQVNIISVLKENFCHKQN